MPEWDPDHYVRFADHRDRPFHELVARVGAPAEEVARVADLGCGPGTLTLTLASRWPHAHVVGVDSSAPMIARARSLTAASGTGPEFVQQDLRDWVEHAGRGRYDVVVSNAALQWVPDHLGLLPQVIDVLRPGGWLAVQIPGNHDAPLHTILRELARTAPFAEYAAPAVERFDLPGPADYLRELSALGCAVDAWETTYLHVLHDDDAVFEWISGTGARPVLQSLPDDVRARFVAEYKARLREAYPAQPWGTPLPFRRVFAVARRPDAGRTTSPT